MPTLSGAPLTLSFGTDGSLNGSSGCNNYSSRYLADDRLVAILPAQVTSMACLQANGAMAQERNFLAALAAATSFSLDGGRLYMRGDGGHLAIEAAPY